MLETRLLLIRLGILALLAPAGSRFAFADGVNQGKIIGYPPFDACTVEVQGNANGALSYRAYSGETGGEDWYFLVVPGGQARLVGKDTLKNGFRVLVTGPPNKGGKVDLPLRIRFDNGGVWKGHFSGNSLASFKLDGEGWEKEAPVKGIVQFSNPPGSTWFTLVFRPAN